MLTVIEDLEFEEEEEVRATFSRVNPRVDYSKKIKAKKNSIQPVNDSGAIEVAFSRTSPTLKEPVRLAFDDSSDEEEVKERMKERKKVFQAKTKALLSMFQVMGHKHQPAPPASIKSVPNEEPATSSQKAAPTEEEDNDNEEDGNANHSKEYSENYESVAENNQNNVEEQNDSDNEPDFRREEDDNPEYPENNNNSDNEEESRDEIQAFEDNKYVTEL